MLKDRIKQSRHTAGITQQALADAVGVKRGAVAMWETGSTKKLEAENLLATAKALKVHPDWLATGKGQKYPTESARDKYPSIADGPAIGTTKEIPIVGTAEGGPSMDWYELGYPAGYGTEYIESPSHDKNAYALIISGNSMAPRMRPGEAVMVEPNHEPQPGDEVVVRTTDGQVMVKLYAAIRESKIMLDSIADNQDRIVLQPSEIDFMHYVAAVFRAGSIKSR